MNILLLTANGREHALAVAYAKSKKTKKIIMVPGNGLTEVSNPKIKNYPSVNPLHVDEVLQICKKENIDFIDVSQDDIIAQGFVDTFQSYGIPTFGPSQNASQIEWDKAWARNFMKKYKLPIPHYETFTDMQKATAYIKNRKEQLLFIKASGLAGGKGVIKAETKDQAIQAIRAMKQFGKSGDTFVIEDALLGEEFSFFVICDGKEYKSIGAAQDHKTVYNNNKGPNTGGMGCISYPAIITPKVSKQIEETIVKPFLFGMQKENRPYSGILYIGGMLTKNGPMVIEFNARWGDPEAQVLLPAIQTDYVDVVMAVQKKQLSTLTIKLDTKKRVSIVGAASGYPQNYQQVLGKEIFGIPNILNMYHVVLFGAAITKKHNKYFVNGGRLFHIVGEGTDILEARRLAYAAMSMVYIDGNNLHYRTDIGWKEMERFF